MSGIYFEARIDSAKLQQDINNINSMLSNMSKQTQKTGKDMDNVFSGIGRQIAAYASIGFAANFVKQVAVVRGEFQMLNVAFETMLGNKERADALMAQIVDYAATTPFELQEVATGAKQLLAYGTEAEKIIPIIQQLGNVSAGLGQPLGRLVTVFGQIQLKGKLMGDDLRQINEAGVPLIAELAKNLGKTESEIQKMVTASQIGAEDVARAFETMAGEGGKFAGMTEKMSKTITGQISNLKDAWNQMLNSIGESNEGLISGALDVGKTLVENYEKVLDILKVLVVAYGSYKAVILATQAIQSTGAAIQTLQSMIKMKESITAATLAQRGFNKAAMINPYVAAIAGVIALVTALKTLYDRSKDVQGNIDELTKSIEDVGKQDSITDLVARYEILNNNTKKTVEEQEEFKRIIIQLGREFPGVITGVDAYGNAISLNTQKLIEQNDELRKQKKILLESNVEDAEDKRAKLLREQARLQKMLSTGKLVGTDLSVQNWYTLSESQIKKYREELIKITGDLGNLQTKIEEGNNAVKGIKSIDAIKLLAPYKELFTKVDGLTDTQANELKRKLEGLLSDPLVAGSEDAKIKIKKQIDDIAAYLSSDTFTERVRKAGEQLKIEQAKLLELKETRASDDVIEKQKGKISELEKFIKGANEKVSASDKKAATDAKKSAEDRTKIIEDLGEKEIEVRNKIEAAKIEAMRDGAQKATAAAQFQYQQELQEIEKFAKERQKAIDEGGFDNPQKAAETEKLNGIIRQSRILAENKLNNEIQQINQDAANRVKEIWQEVNESYLSDYDRQIKDVRDKSDELARAMIDQGGGIADATEKSLEYKAKRMTQIDREATLQKLDDQEELEQAQIEADDRYINNEEAKQKELLRITIKYGKQRLAILDASGKSEDKKRAVLLREALKKANNDLNSMASGTVTENFRDIANAVGQINSELGESLNNLVDMVAAGDDFVKAIKGGEDGIIGITDAINIAGAAMKIISMLNQSIKGTDYTSQEKQIERFDRLTAAMDRLISTMNNLESFQASKIRVNQLITQINEERKKIKPISLFIDDKPTLFDLSKMNTRELVLFLSKFQIGGEYYDLFKNNDAVMRWVDQKITSVEKLLEYEGEINRITEDILVRATGTTAEAVTDGILEGFENGYNSIEDFSANFETLMRNAILNALKAAILEGPALREFTDSFMVATEDSILTPEERKKLKDDWDALIQTALDKAKYFKEVTGEEIISPKKEETNTDEEGRNLTSAVKGITEETAGLIAGQFTAMRENLMNLKTFTLSIRDALPAITLSMQQLVSNNSANYTEFTATRAAVEGIENNAQLQLAAVNESVTHLASIDRKLTDVAKLNSIDSRLEELNKNIKNL